MARNHVPVSMGSPEFTVVDAGPFQITDARFPPGAHLSDHSHQRTTFAVMVEGSFDLLLPGRRLECPPSTVLTEPAGERHANEISPRGAHVIVVQPDPEDSDLIEPCLPMLETLNHLSVGGVFELARRLGREVEEPDDVSPLSMQAIALEMLVRAARVKEARQSGRRPPAWLARVRDLIHEHFRERLTLADLAREAGVHPAHLACVFREHHGVPVGTYIRRLKLEWAADRVASTRSALGRIAVQAGFADQSHFNRLFKRRMGMTPGQYRRARGN